MIQSKNKQQMVLLIHKTIHKTKEVPLSMSEVMTLFHIKKTLRLTNRVYPSWIKVHANVAVFDDQLQHVECGTVIHYRDGKSITFYFPDRGEGPSAAWTLLHKDIELMSAQKGRIWTANVEICLSTDVCLSCSFQALQRTLREQGVPRAICRMIWDFAKTKAMRMFRLLEEHRELREKAKVWQVNTRSVLGVRFRVKEDVVCRGVEVRANFGKVCLQFRSTIQGAYLTFDICIKCVQISFHERHLWDAKVLSPPLLLSVTQ